MTETWTSWALMLLTLMGAGTPPAQPLRAGPARFIHALSRPGQDGQETPPARPSGRRRPTDPEDPTCET